MHELAEYLKKNIKVAAKSVRFNIKKYLPFFAAVFIIQLFFGILLFSADKASLAEKQIVDADYHYHVLYRKLNEQQYIYLLKYAYGGNNQSAIFEITDTRSSPGYSVTDPHFDLYILLRGDSPGEVFRSFKSRFHASLLSLADKDASIGYTTTALLHNNGSSVRSGTSLACFFLVILSVLLLTVLYTVRINNYKFEYGIYMTFGADFRKLSENALFEMLIVTIVTFVPATLVSLLMTFFIHGGVFLRFDTVLLLLFLSLLCSVSSVFFPMFAVSRAYPMKHITAADNSDLVSSPRVSFEMLGKKIKRHYEPFTVFRFRKYFLKIISVSVAFTAVATGVYYVSGMAKTKEEACFPQFSLNFSDKGLAYDEVMRKELYAFEGVSCTNKYDETVAMDINSHLLFKKGTVAPFSGFAVPPSNRYGEYAYGNDSAVYRSCDSEVLNYLKSYTYEGEPENVLTLENAAIVGECINNHRKLKIKPGDKIYAAIPVGYNEDSTVSLEELNYATGKKLFKLKLEVYNYKYVELTVAAVIKDIPCNKYMPIYLSEQTYLSLAYPFSKSEELAAEYDTVYVYTKPEMTENEIRSLENRLMDWAESYGSFTVNNLQAHANSQILGAMKIPELCIGIALLIAALSPVIWLFSQIVFYRKRYPEMDILSALGAVSNEIKHLFLSDGIFAGGLAALFTGILSTLLFRAVHYYGNSIGAVSGVFFNFKFPTLLYIAAILLSAICAFASVYVSYIIYIKENSGEPDIFSGE